MLIDGGEALPRLADALSGARSHVHIAGWHLTPAFGLTRDERASRLRDLLGELAERIDVRVLLWAGAPVRFFTPARGAVRGVRDELVRGTRVQCALDSRERPMHCHHEKLVIIDGEVAFVGGIDLTSLGGDRFDTSDHPMHGRLGWHDAASEVRGPAVADVAAHFAARWRETTGERVEPTPTPAPAGDVELQVVRTVPDRIYDFLPQGDFRIVEAYTRALRSRTQARLSREPVPVVPPSGRDPRQQASRAARATTSAWSWCYPPSRTTAPTRPAASWGCWPRPTTAPVGSWQRPSRPVAEGSRRPLYVHAKIGIVDDAWLTVGSANLNEHSFFNDSEMNVVTCDPIGSHARPGCGSGPSTSSARSTASPATRPESSTSCGARSPESSSSGGVAASP